MASRYVPDRGDVVWLQFSPQVGHEQAGQRPALVVSPRTYNRKAGLALFCPIASSVKDYPFEVLLPEGLPATGCILSDQVRSLDWRERKARRWCRVPPETMDAVRGRIRALVD